MAEIALAGKWILTVAGGIFLATMAALAVYTLRRGEPDEEPVRPGLRPLGPGTPSEQAGTVAYKGVARLKTLVSRRKFITMKSLLDGTATRDERAAVFGIQLAFVSFWLVFLGAALMGLPDTGWPILILPLIVGLWLFGILSAQYRDWIRARRKLARAARKPLR